MTSDRWEHIFTLFDAMEYLEGETLAARLRQGPMPLTQLIDSSELRACGAKRTM